MNKDVDDDSILVRDGNDLLGRHFNLLDQSCGRRYGLTMQTHSFDVELDGFPDQLAGFLQGGACGHAAGKVGDVRAITGRGLCEEYRVLVHFRPACLSIDAFDFGSKSSEGWPAMVTVPGFVG
jgi:hypothetical protein